MRLADLRVKTKLMLACALIATIVLLVSALALRSLGASNDRFSSYLASVGLRETLATQLRTGARLLTVDASGLKFLDSASLRVLILAARALKAN